MKARRGMDPSGCLSLNEFPSTALGMLSVESGRVLSHKNHLARWNTCLYIPQPLAACLVRRFNKWH